MIAEDEKEPDATPKPEESIFPVEGNVQLVWMLHCFPVMQLLSSVMQWSVNPEETLTITSSLGFPVCRDFTEIFP